MSQAIISLQEFSLAIEGHRILDRISLDIHPGEYVAIIGPNGAGKTTLLKCLNRILRGGRGVITLDGRPLERYAQRGLARWLAYVPQADGRTAPFTVHDFVMMGRYPYLSPFAGPGRKDDEAVRGALERTGMAALAHDHAFHGERGDRYATRYPVLRAIIEDCFPPHLPNLRHAVINTYCRDSLKREMGIEPVVIPNVMDFEHAFARRDLFNRALPEALGCGRDDTLLFQITRIVRRKGIETAIELVHRLEDPSVRLVITGTSRDDWNEEYTDELRAQVADLGLGDAVLFAGERFDAVRGSDAAGRPVFSLEDAYAHATACTYFSLYEGFGNAFVEALLARRPIFLNNYKPVYWPDIGSKGFRTVQIEDNVLTDDAVDTVRSILSDPKARRETAEHNFTLGRRYFSFDVLEELLDDRLSQRSRAAV